VPSVYDLKPKFQALLRPLMNRLVSVGFTPNAVTLLALLGSVAVGGLLLQAHGTPSLLLLLPMWLFARMALNAIDGMMAREHQMATPLGAVLNELGDVASDLALYLPLAAVEEQSRWLVVGFCIGAILTEFCGVLGQALGTSRHYEGPMGKSDRAFWVGALAVVTFASPKTYEFWPWVFGIGALLTAVTCGNRLARTLAELKR
jgi:CDP-diacylglycerol---glycerol-3-phosphate 3-phosphatidyltransferase